MIQYSISATSDLCWYSAVSIIFSIHHHIQNTILCLIFQPALNLDLYPLAPFLHRHPLTLNTQYWIRWPTSICVGVRSCSYDQASSSVSWSLTPNNETPMSPILMSNVPSWVPHWHYYQATCYMNMYLILWHRPWPPETALLVTSTMNDGLNRNICFMKLCVLLQLMRRS